MNFVVLNRRATTETEFIQIWSEMYFDQYEAYYTRNIGKPLTASAVRELFYWKNGGPLSGQKAESIETHFIAELPILGTMSADYDVRSFFKRFSQGGPIWRIFFLHIWQPNKYPIYDQHVYRSMCFLVYGRRGELSQRPRDIIESYVDSYIPFHARFVECQNREVDKALWMFGRFLRSPFSTSCTGLTGEGAPD